MNIKKCDRCGKEMIRAEASIRITDFTLHNEPEMQYDVCKECAIEIDHSFTALRKALQDRCDRSVDNGN